MIKQVATILFTIFFVLSSCCSADSVWDYCVGDLSLPTGVSGYSCKDPAKVSTDDFVYSGLSIPGNTSNAFKFGASVALAPQFPGLNGLGLSLVRADIGVGGAVPLHTHRVSELIIVIQGTIIAGFIDSNNTPYYRKLNKWDMMILPQGLLHFQVNVGKTPGIVLASFNSPNPGVEIVSTALFQNDLPSEIVQAVTKLDLAQIKKLKKAFGGTN